MQQPKMIELARQLLETSRAGKVMWGEGLHSDSYRADLPNVSLVITRTRFDPEAYRLDLFDDKGRKIESLAADPLDHPFPDHPEEEVMRLIHDIARRHVLDIDQNIDKALEYLRRA